MQVLESCRLVVRRLVHERFSTLCLVLSLISVLLPAMLLFGLKTGFISATRDRMLSNPEALAIRHRASKSISPEMLARIAAWPETGFVIPTTRMTSSMVSLVAPGKVELFSHAPFDLKPTADGDPVIRAYGVPAPADEGQVCIGSGVAEKTGLAAGDKAELVVARRVNGTPQFRRMPVVVCGVLPPRAGNRNSIYAPISVVDDVECYKENAMGSGVGSAMLPPRVAGGVLLKGDVDEGKLRSRLNVSRLVTIGKAELEESRYAGLAEGQHLALFSNPLANAQLERACSIAAELGLEATVWNPAVECRLQGRSFLLCQDASLPADAPQAPSEAPVLYAAEALAGPLLLELRGSRIMCRCDVKAGLAAGQLRVSPGLLSLLSAPVSIEWDYANAHCRPRRQYYSSFRLYAASAEALAPLLARVKELFPACTADVNRIDAMATLDRNLTVLCMLVAGIGGAGGACMLTLSLFHSTERRQGEYALLKTFGMKALPLALCPLLEALLLLALAFGASYGLYLLLSDYADYLLQEQLMAGETICSLPQESVAALAALSLGLVFLSSLASAFYILRISPSQALRAN